MSKTRSLVVVGIASVAMGLSTLGSATAASAAPLNPGVWGAADTSESALAPTPKVPVCKPPDCYYA